MSQIASAVAYLHSLTPAVVHRDLKPHNILLDGSFTVCKVADLGLSRVMHRSYLTATQSQAGTPAFMAPEQWEGTNVGVKCDVYALGMIMWSCLAGHMPFVEMTNHFQLWTAVNILGSRPDIPDHWPKALS